MTGASTAKFGQEEGGVWSGQLHSRAPREYANDNPIHAKRKGFSVARQLQ